MPSKIEWCDETWNPIIGCSKISAGCDNCYAERMAGRLSNIAATHKNYSQVVYWGVKNGMYYGEGRWNGNTAFIPEALDKPLRWARPRRIFVCSMGDLFHESVPFAWLNRLFITMAANPRHTFMLLTKRPEIAVEFMSIGWRGECPNIWIGVTAENQAAADERIPILLQIPAAVRFVSVEPMLGPLSLKKWLHPEIEETAGCATVGDINWVICGGESGPGARPMHSDWVRGLRDQCQAAGTPFLFKQWGEWAPNWINDDAGNEIEGSMWMDRFGKKKAGRLLDGVEHNEFPA
jgi:protein gp37